MGDGRGEYEFPGVHAVMIMKHYMIAMPFKDPCRLQKG